MTLPLGLYIHWPFCVSKCPYCDFNSHVHRSISEEEWSDVLLANMQEFANLTPTHHLKSIFFGGGTPSLMQPSTVERIITQALKTWRSQDNIEITLEANPNSVEVSKFLDLQKAGVNRVSIGVQSFNEEDLKFLGRNHSQKEAIQAIETGLSIFKNMSFDLIYARPNQTIQKWEDELNFAMSFNSPHLSLYQLTIEPGTSFEKQYARGDWHIPSHEKSIELYELTADILKQKELYPYEISNYAKKGFESQHNLIYWRYQDFIGIGPGAHGRLNLNGKVHAYKQESSPLKWKTMPKTEEILSDYEAFQEKLIMGFRIFDPIVLSDFEFNYISMENLKTLVNQDFLLENHNTIEITPKGRLVLNTVTSALLK